MSLKKQSDNGKISTTQMRKAIQRSGYLLEQRVEPTIRQSFGYVETNPIYKDPATGKSREIDIRGLGAEQVYKEERSFIFPMILCECENNSQPIVFFTKEPLVPYIYRDDIKVSGIPVQFWQNSGYINLAEFTGIEKFHHYFKDDIATQYCTFQLKKDKSSWLAFHSEEQHDTFNSLIKAVDYEVADHFNNWVLPDKVDEEDINIQIYYPLLIIQGDLYSAYLKSNRLILRKAKHIQFRKQLFSTYTNKVETYQIDVIIEGYLPRYLQIIGQEIEMIKKVLQRKKTKTFESIEKIVKEAKEGGKELDSYRKYLEF